MVKKHLFMVFHWSMAKKQLVCNFCEDSFKFLDSQWQKNATVQFEYSIYIHFKQYDYTQFFLEFTGKGLLYFGMWKRKV